MNFARKGLDGGALYRAMAFLATSTQMLLIAEMSTQAGEASVGPVSRLALVFHDNYWRTNLVALVNSNGAIATTRYRRNGSTSPPRCLECNKQCRVPERPRVTPR